MTDEVVKNESEVLDLETENSENTSTKKPKKKIIIGVVVAVVLLVACIGGGVAYADHLEKERVAAETEAHDSAVVALYDKYAAELDSLEFNLETEEIDRNGLLGTLADLEDFSDEVLADKPSFELYDGEYYDYKPLLTEAESKVNELKAWFLGGYDATFESFVIANLAAGEATKELLSSSIEGFQSLLVLAESESEASLWDNQEEYDAFVAKVNAEIETYNARIAEIEEAERIAAEEAAAAAAEQASRSSNSSSGNYSGGSSSGGSGGGSSSGGMYWFNDEEKIQHGSGGKGLPDEILPDGTPIWH